MGSLALAACGSCPAEQVGRQVIDSGGTVIFAEFSHCSALNNGVDFYFQHPGEDKILLGHGADLGDFAQFYDETRRLIVIMTPIPSDVRVKSAKQGDYTVRTAALRIRNADEQANFDFWEEYPDSPYAKRWMRAYLGL